MAGIGAQTGTLEQGKAADMIVTAGNPLEDLRALRQVEMVVARGHILSHPVFRRRKRVERELDRFL